MSLSNSRTCKKEGGTTRYEESCLSFFGSFLVPFFFSFFFSCTLSLTFFFFSSRFLIFYYFFLLSYDGCYNFFCCDKVGSIPCLDINRYTFQVGGTIMKTVQPPAVRPAPPGRSLPSTPPPTVPLHFSLVFFYVNISKIHPNRIFLPLAQNN